MMISLDANINGVTTGVWFLFESWPRIRAIGSRAHLLFEHSRYGARLRIAREAIRSRAQAISEAVRSRAREAMRSRAREIRIQLKKTWRHDS